MDWEEALAGWIGRLVEIRIEDQLDLDPLAPPKLITLHQVKYANNRKELCFYLNENQFLSVPLFLEPNTQLLSNTFESVDERSKLIYRAILV
ncbi:hypothetical protein [Paenibacillus montanisoli]|uniref:Uncharacterized protein n=1 Tax=Paenibacillus montanisoli TaxID=2081970 RepID=A0A328U8S1_9BACL|nr:hypothetical protein [Paenibacillus montanisoli]RAP76534.1 hypothetical protein DL346_14250 [Paenibacillus montanisoli]